MRTLSILFLLAPFFFLVTSAAEASVIKHQSYDGDVEVIWSFANNADTERLLKAYANIIPEASNPRYSTARQLELCTDDHTVYMPCGSRNFHAPNFLANARINLNLSLADLSYLKSLPRTPELNPLLDYYINALEFAIWLEQTRLDFIETGDVRVLSSPFKNFNTAQVAAAAIREIQNAPTKQKKIDIVSYKWHNDLNNAYRNKLGVLPEQAWQNFLKSRGVTQKVNYLMAP